MAAYGPRIVNDAMLGGHHAVGRTRLQGPRRPWLLTPPGVTSRPSREGRGSRQDDGRGTRPRPSARGAPLRAGSRQGPCTLERGFLCAPCEESS